jgi:hypothetical protein
MINTAGARDGLVLNQLASSDRTFWLTGSRFFGTHSHNSDYDFFTQHDEDVERYLEMELGFHREWSESYTDPIAKSCWRKDNVHVQVVSDADLKLDVQMWLKEHPRLLGFDKRLNRAVWTTAICAFQDLLSPIRENKDESKNPTHSPVC